MTAPMVVCEFTSCYFALPMTTLPTPIIILDTEHVVITVSIEERTIALKWKGYAPTQDFRAALEAGLEAVKEHDLRFWLADLRGMSAILRRDEQWTTSDWFPRLAATGLKRMAIVTSTDLFNQMSVDRIMDDAAAVIVFQTSYFDDPDVARLWLSS